MVSVFLNELRLLLRDRWAVVYLLIAPIVVVTVIVSARFEGEEKARIALPVVDEDGGPAAVALLEILSEHARPERMSRAHAESVVRDQNRAAAALVIPTGFSSHSAAGESSDFRLLTDPAQASGVHTALVLLLLAEQELRARQDPLDQDMLSLRETSLTSARTSVKSHEQNVPGFSLMFVMLASVGGIATSLHYERDCRTIERLLISPRGFTWLLLGKLGARWLIGFVQMMALLVWCHFLFGVSLGSSPWAAPVLTSVIVLATTGLGMLVASLVSTREQTLMVSLTLVLVLCAFGGLWWPEQLEPGWMQRIAPFFFTTWAMRGMTDVVLRDRGLAEMLRPLGMLLLHALALLALGLAVFRARYSHR